MADPHSFDDADNIPEGWALVEKFVVVESAGGEYDDNSFVAGMYYQMFCDHLDRIAGVTEDPVCLATAFPVGIWEQMDLHALSKGWQLGWLDPDFDASWGDLPIAGNEPRPSPVGSGEEWVTVVVSRPEEGVYDLLCEDGA